MSEQYIKKIEQINFGLLSPEDIRKMSVVTVEYPDTYGDDGFPIDKGLMDPRLGIIDPSLVCRTCGFKGGDCSGHFGSIELARPVIHAGFGDVVHKLLRSTCNECGRILLNDKQMEFYEVKIREAMGNKESINNILKDVYKSAKRELKTLSDYDGEIDMRYCCPHCGTPQEAIILDKPVTIRQGNYKLTPAEVRERLERISDEDAFILGVNPEVARPEWLVLTVLPVPPVTVRPSITLDTGERSEDDLTHKLVDILRINQRLLENMEAGAPQLIVEDLWELLQYHVTTYFDNEALGVPPARHRSGRPLKTLIQRLKGKEGRFRSNLAGKRVNFSARTVISPDPNISINEVGVPEMIAKEVTVPVYVNEWNINEIKQYLMNGPDVHPGVQYVRMGNTKRRVTDENKEFIFENLMYGDIIERHLKDGDMVLFNRQPSLHRMSMMAHEVRVMPYKTFRINPALCPPYNADFDGDEMNMHIFQTDESRAEAKSLMRVQEHILSPRFGGPVIGAIHDHISGAYLLTRDGVEFTEEEALQIIRKSHLPIPRLQYRKWVLKYDSGFSEDTFIFKDKGDKWTGKELFSLLLPNDLNLSYNADISKSPIVYPESDAKVVIKNGILTQGVIDNSAFGSFSGKILDKIVKEYGSGRAKEFLDRATDLSIASITKFGMTTSLNDEEIPEEAQDRINEHLNKKMEEVDFLVYSYEGGYLQALPGRDLEETLEMKIIQVLGEARDMSGSIAENYLTMGKQYPEDPYDHVMAVENHSVVMARTGARASMLNLTQTVACVGQQMIRGGRIERGYLNRTLPHFKKGELGAKAKGFVHSSFKSGLDPIEFFFHAIGGREGLVDTAIRTAQSGYMQRRLVNALQDLSVDFNGVVKDNQGNVIQTMYGDDGVDPAKSDFGKPADLNKLIDEIRIKSKSDSENKFPEIIIEDNPQTKQLKTKLESLINKYDDLSNQVVVEIEEFKSHGINNNLNVLLTKIKKDMMSLDESMGSNDVDVLSSSLEMYTVYYDVSKSNFKEEVVILNRLNKELFKKEVQSETKLFKAIINNISKEFDNQKINENTFISQLDEFNENCSSLGGNFLPDLENNKENILNYCQNLKIDFESGVKTDAEIQNSLSKINNEYEELCKYPKINEEFLNKSDDLELEVSKIREGLKKDELSLFEFKNKFNGIMDEYGELLERLNDVDGILEELNNLNEPIRKIEEDISNQVTKQDALEKEVRELYNTIIKIDGVAYNVTTIKNSLTKDLNNLYEEIAEHEGFDLEYRSHFPVLKNIHANLMNLSMNYTVFKHNFALLNEHVANVSDKIKYHEDIINQFEIDYKNQKSLYDESFKDLDNQTQENTVENVSDELYDQLIKYNELLKMGIITQDDYDELKRKLIFGNDSGEDNKVEDNENVLEFRNFVNNSPFYGFIRNGFANISDDEETEILNEIESEIREGKITGTNWNDIIKSKFQDYNKGDHVTNLINALNEFISDSEFYKSLSNDFSDLSDDEKDESIEKLKNMFTSDFKQDDIPFNLKIIFEEKRKEKHDLMLLNEYRRNISSYMSRYNLYENEVIALFDFAQNEIYTSHLDGKSFEEFMVHLFNDKVDENKTSARSAFALFVNKRSILKEITMLDDRQVSVFINEIQIQISNNEIRDYEITEEFLMRRSVRYRK